MIEGNRIKLLDCTLRDGGYVNNWDFNYEEYNSVIRGLCSAGTDYIEVGIMGKDCSDAFNTKFNSYEEIPPLTHISQEQYTVMTTIGEAENIPVPYKTEKSVDAIRVAFFKPDIEKMIRLSKDIKSKGFKVFLQAMATYMYNTEELKELMIIVSELEADAFYLVDSFGTLYPQDVVNMVGVVNEALNVSVSVGYHAHNNIQLAFANDITFIEEMLKLGRNEIMVDATIYGMGRGAGNTPTELLARFLNDRCDKNYDTDIILDLYRDVISEKYKENYWGYEYLYFLSSKYKVNMAYIWYLREFKKIKDENLIGKVLARIPEESKFTLNREVADSLIGDCAL